MIDINKVANALTAYKEQLGDKAFFPADLINYMEPYFKEAGFRQARPNGEPKEILVIKDDAAGDFVLFSPVLRELRRMYPAAHITLLASSRNGGLTPSCPYVDNIIIQNNNFDMENFALGYQKTLEEAIQLLRYNFDIAFGGRVGIRSFSLLAMYMCGARVRVGFTQNRLNPSGEIPDAGWDCLLTDVVPWSTNGIHDVDRNLMLLEKILKLPIDNREIEVWFNNIDRKKADEVLKPLFKAREKDKKLPKSEITQLVALVPSASVKMKVWPLERFVETAKEILKMDASIAFVCLGGPVDKAAGEAFVKAVGKKYAINLAGSLKFTESAAVIDKCKMYFGCDTGLMHIAAALKKPVLSINCYPGDLQMDYMAVPLRFYPYRVPSVTVYPAKHTDDCTDRWRHGCNVWNRPHCILGVQTYMVLAGFKKLLEQIKNKNTKPVFMK